ncbi:MAG: hypothetical protein IPF39_15495 [Comamonadaceae bacterium]|uniref:hypothetical protein n=1 Tax=Candidatus Skiveiella danica TaxID=3386177 RepID=UPI003908DC3F|nr:hypothetical protein [Comamonadaceae bacterium]
MYHSKKSFTRSAFAAAALLAATASHAEMSAEELAKLAQNPVGNLISVPFQNNTNLNTGPLKGNQNILNIQPVIPIEVTPEWNIITRTILPVISQPAMFPGDDRTNGIGDMVVTAFLSPAVPKGLIWGVGPVFQLPTDTNGLGNKNWGLGASFVVLKMEKGDPWVYGALVNNIWSLTSDQTGGSYSNGLIQPFVNYNFAGGLPDQCTDHHGELESGQRPAMDRAAGRRCGQDLPPGPAAGEHAAFGLLQRGQARLRAELADPRASAADVSEVKGSIPLPRSRNVCGCWPSCKLLLA